MDVWILVHERANCLKDVRNFGNASDFLKYVLKLLILNILAGICADQMVFGLTGCVSVMKSRNSMVICKTGCCFLWTIAFSFRFLCLALECWEFERFLRVLGHLQMNLNHTARSSMRSLVFPLVVGNHGPAAVGERKLKGIFLYFVSLVRA